MDESLYSRQIHAIGKDAMKKITEASVCIVGMRGLGLEIAKCLILSGISKLGLCDDKFVTQDELSVNYYANKSDLYIKLRVDTVYEELCNLNSNVKIEKHTDKFRYSYLDNYSIVVLTDIDLITAIPINDYCRKKGIKFLYACTNGLYGFIFSDYGDNYSVSETNSQNPKSGIIVKTTDKIIETDKPHKLFVNDKIRILSEPPIETYITQVHDMCHFSVKDDVNVSACRFIELKQGHTYNFKSLMESYRCPEFVEIDLCEFDKVPSLHEFTIALSCFIHKYKRMPNQFSETDIAELVKFCSFNANIEIIKKLASTCNGNIMPVVSIIGGIIAQQVLNACANKCQPIMQWMYYDALILLQEKCNKIDNMSRYFGQEIVFGNEFQKKLKDTTVFVVGSGAIGCEHLKNFSMMGVGNIIVTDMDRIEKSNLSRQFLFRNSDIGKFKSEVARDAILKMNNEISVDAHLNKVCNETINIYNNKFFDKLTCVANALDNIEARQFVDRLCVENTKPLLESGTLGTQGNVQTIIPFLTMNYGSHSGSEEDSVPVCTLKNFPYEPEHAMQWARDLFEGMFTKAPSNYNKSLASDLNNLETTTLAEIYDDLKFLTSKTFHAYKDCVLFSWNKWHELFSFAIENLLEQFPINKKNDDGTPFWNGSKKCPKVLKFDVNNKIHVDFVFYMSKLLAQMLDITVKSSYDAVKAFLGKLTIPKNTMLKSESTEEKIYDRQMLINEIEKMKKHKLVMTPLIFEKDDETNYHMDFITSASNMRCENYNIPQSDKFKTTGVVGKIIPALASTTTVVSGLVAIELYKVVMGFNDISKFRDSWLDLGSSFITFTEPHGVKIKKVNGLELSIWHKQKFNDVKLKDLIKFFEDKEFDVCAITNGNKTIYQNFGTVNNEKKERFMSQFKDDPEDDVLTINVICENEIIPCEIRFV